MDIIGLIGICVTGSIAIISLVHNIRWHKKQFTTEQERNNRQLEREDKIREEDHRREIERIHSKREDIPQIEFDISCNIVGEKDEQSVVEFLIILNNKGFVKLDIKSIKFRVRSIKITDELSFWEESPYRLEFPHKLFETQVIPKGYGFIFIEPNVKQNLSFTTKFDNETLFIATRAEFSYGLTRKGSRGSKHSVERIFRLQ